jgi:hypothetical protein
VHPTALLTCLGIDFFQRRPEPDGTITNRQFWPVHAA